MASHNFHANIKELPKMLLWIRSHLIEAGMDAGSIQKIELASEEAIVNVIHHGYKDKGGKIELSFDRLPNQVEISIADQAPPFDPLAAAPPADLDSPLEERQIGGLGIYLMRECLDGLRYRRENGLNILTLIKRLSTK